MRVEWAVDRGDCRFELPPRFTVIERRMSGRALDAWAACNHGIVAGFDDNSLVIRDPGERSTVETAGDAVIAIFGLAPGMLLNSRDALASELCAACDLIALRPLPVPFEASLLAPGRACILVRGIALPIAGARGAAERVQIVVSWREVLNRAATTRLKRELSAALRQSLPSMATSDPFSAENAG